MLLQKCCDRNGRCIAVGFRSIGVGGRFDSFWRSVATLKSAGQKDFFEELRGGNVNSETKCLIWSFLGEAPEKFKSRYV